jgi:hypothetical protein
LRGGGKFRFPNRPAVGRAGGAMSTPPSREKKLKLARKDVLQSNFQLVKNSVQFVQGEMMLSALQTMEGRVRQANFL